MTTLPFAKRSPLFRGLTIGSGLAALSLFLAVLSNGGLSPEDWQRAFYAIAASLLFVACLDGAEILQRNPSLAAVSARQAFWLNAFALGSYFGCIMLCLSVNFADMDNPTDLPIWMVVSAVTGMAIARVQGPDRARDLTVYYQLDGPHVQSRAARAYLLAGPPLVVAAFAGLVLFWQPHPDGYLPFAAILLFSAFQAFPLSSQVPWFKNPRPLGVAILLAGLLLL